MRLRYSNENGLKCIRSVSPCRAVVSIKTESQLAQVCKTSNAQNTEQAPFKIVKIICILAHTVADEAEAAGQRTRVN